MRDAIHSALAPYLADFSGACLIRQNGETLIEYCGGLANRDFNIPNTMRTKFDTASITKAFTAAAVLSCAEKGLFSLDSRICDLTDLKGTTISADITLAHLLTHTSGIADDADEESGEKYEDLFVDKPNYALRCCRDFLPNFAYKPPCFAPGEGVRYNNCAFILLGLAMESVSGRDSREVIKEFVFDKCGMADTGFFAKDEAEPNRAEGYFAQMDTEGGFVRWKKNIYSYPPIGTPDGGAYTTVWDLERLMRSILDGKLLSGATTARFLRPQCGHFRENKHGRWTTGYAFEFILDDEGIFCMYKEGGNVGVDGITAYFPQADLTAHMLANQEGPLWRMFEEVKSVISMEWLI